jgi:Rod binding domain-containing protein
MIVPHVGPANSTTPPQNAKIVHAAQQFEAILLNSLFGSLQRTFSEIGGKSNNDSTNYGYIGMQALSSTLAARGGIGIANRIVASLQQGNPVGQVTK